jgi:hypothetical protein
MRSEELAMLVNVDKGLASDRVVIERLFPRDAIKSEMARSSSAGLPGRAFERFARR